MTAADRQRRRPGRLGWPARPRLPPWLRWPIRPGYTARTLIATVAIVLVPGVAVLAVATARGLMPLPSTLDVAAGGDERPRFTDRNGLPLNTTYTSEWNVHDRLPLHEMPAFLREAFIHAEDKRFYRNHGADWRARLAALATNLRYLDRIRGASTISEQTVRMLHPRPRTVWSRWLEGFDAARLEARFGKDAILNFYLNQVPYAARRRGVRQAAEFYFARDLATLSDREMLALAVLVRSPSRLDLHDDPDASAAAIGRLADLMRNRGALEPARHAAILAHPVELKAASLDIRTPHFLRFAAARHDARAATATTVPTTLDGRLQARIQNLLDTRMAALAESGVDHGAVLVVDNATGEVLAWVVAGGGKAEVDSHIDPITTPRQPGSALKPMLYALALERGATLADILIDAPLAESVGDGLHRYRNYSERHYGPVTLRDALGNSLNIPALKLLHGIGPVDYLAHLERLGIASLGAHPDVYGDGLALGNGELTLFELVQAYQAHANRGRLVPLRVLAEPIEHRVGAAVVSAETASLLADALSDPEARSAEFGRDSVLNFPVQTAVKTGTSSDYRDAWTLGFDARYTVGIWMGNLDQTPTRGITGATGPALLLRSVFANLNRDGATRPLYLSPKLTRAAVCVPSPLSAGPDCSRREEWFDPAHAVPAPSAMPTESMAAASASAPRLRRPTDGLELAWDPRLPAASQAFEFELEGVAVDAEVRWSIDGAIRVARGASFLWPVERGTHRVSAVVVGDGVSVGPVEFVVR